MIGHQPLTQVQLVVALVLVVQSFLLWFLCPAIWRRTDWGAFSRVMVVFCRLMGVLVGATAGTLLWQAAMYGLKP
jgi:hypothetical protein